MFLEFAGIAHETYLPVGKSERIKDEVSYLARERPFGRTVP